MAIAHTFWEHHTVDERGCWNWTRRKTPKGYGLLYLNGGTALAHRHAYALTHDGIPDGMLIRHTCDNPSCVNPAHLVVGTPADNTRDMHERGRYKKPPRATHCKRGHEYIPENTWTHATTGARRCRACLRVLSQQWRSTSKGAAYVRAANAKRCRKANNLARSN